MTYSLPKFTYDEIKKLNPNFDFEGYKLVEGIKLGEFHNYCLVSVNSNPFHIIWLDGNGIIINKSLEYVRLIKETDKKTKILEEQMKNEMCKPINEDDLYAVWDVWDARNKSINQKIKGLGRLLRKRQKLHKENGSSYHQNKLNELERI